MDTNKYTAKAVEAVQGAQNVALEHDNQEIKPEHFLYALLDDENGLIYKILTGLQVSADSLKGAVENVIKSFPRVSGEGASMYLGNEAAKVVAAAEKYAKKTATRTSESNIFLKVFSTTRRRISKNCFLRTAWTRRRFWTL